MQCSMLEMGLSETSHIIFHHSLLRHDRVVAWTVVVCTTFVPALAQTFTTGTRHLIDLPDPPNLGDFYGALIRRVRDLDRG